MLTSCGTAVYTPAVSDFQKSARIAMGENEFECSVSYLSGSVSVTALSSNAKGFSFEYDGANLNCKYGSLEYRQESDNAPQLNPAVLIYNIIYYVENSENLSADLLDDGHRFSGTVSAGSFVMYQNSAGEPISIEIEEAGVYIYFE